jgi:hypothetical protein
LPIDSWWYPGCGDEPEAGDDVGSGTHSVEQANAAADAELKAHTVMSASAATPTTATIGIRNRSKKLFCWA